MQKVIASFYIYLPVWWGSWWRPCRGCFLGWRWSWASAPWFPLSRGRCTCSSQSSATNESGLSLLIFQCWGSWWGSWSSCRTLHSRIRAPPPRSCPSPSQTCADPSPRSHMPFHVPPDASYVWVQKRQSPNLSSYL